MSLLPALLVGTHLAHLAPVDLAIVVIYFAAVLGLGLYLKKRTDTGEEFFLAGRGMSAWVAGLSFLAANLGALELMGWAASAYEYGILAVHWYWIGAIPAMVFLALVMMPFYYISRTHSVPGYLRLRYGEATRSLSAVCFAGMTVLMSGINMFAMAKVMEVVLGWNLHFSIWVSSITVAIYVALGGLTSAILNEVLQFFLIWCGALVIPIVGLIEAGGWTALKQQIIHNFGASYIHAWTTLGSFRANPMGIHWTGIVFGLGFVISFGYWTTDFLVVQRVIAAKDLRAAKMAPIIGAYFKMAVPLIVILPGLIALGVLGTGAHPIHLVAESVAKAGQPTYNDVLPLMLVRYAGPGLMGLGITALIAGFMSGMAGNVSAFATVWTYDIYRPAVRKLRGLSAIEDVAPMAAAAGAAGEGVTVGSTAEASGDLPDRHYLAMGRWSTIVGVLVSVGTAYLAMQFNSIMDYVQALFSFFVAPLLGTVLLGMLWKRATKAAGFWGLLAGTCASIGMWAWARLDPAALSVVALSRYAKPMADDMYRALWSWIVCVVVTVVVSLCTAPRPVGELRGLVYGCTPLPKESEYAWWQRPLFWGILVLVILVWLNWIFR